MKYKLCFKTPGRRPNISAGQSTESPSAVSNTSGTLPLFPQADRPIRMVRHRGPKLVPVTSLRILFRKRRLLYYEERRRISKVIARHENNWDRARMVYRLRKNLEKELSIC